MRKRYVYYRRSTNVGLDADRLVPCLQENGSLREQIRMYQAGEKNPECEVAQTVQVVSYKCASLQREPTWTTLTIVGYSA